jgi:hypothetical protein
VVADMTGTAHWLAVRRQVPSDASEPGSPP